MPVVLIQSKSYSTSCLLCQRTGLEYLHVMPRRALELVLYQSGSQILT